ncbi:MAG: leucine-rich repeat domain-containing protein [Oscillospiraceae bacterium]|jgi:hypothetical protein|nr:leucine-rich repeat domain-containing protein [Oscillospiraceae bacterium]
MKSFKKAIMLSIMAFASWKSLSGVQAVNTILGRRANGCVHRIGAFDDLGKKFYLYIFQQDGEDLRMGHLIQIGLEEGVTDYGKMTIPGFVELNNPLNRESTLSVKISYIGNPGGYELLGPMMRDDDGYGVDSLCFNGFVDEYDKKVHSLSIKPEVLKRISALGVFGRTREKIEKNGGVFDTKIESIVIPDGVRVRTGAFSQINVKNVFIGDGVEVETAAFSNSGCSSLLRQKSSDLVFEPVRIDGFDGCLDLKTVVLPPCFGISRYSFISSGCERLVFSGQEESIDGFENSKLVAIELPERVIVVEKDAFHGSMGLERVTVPVSLGRLGGFSSCENLKIVSFDAGSRLRAISDFAFEKDVSLTAIQIPECVEFLGQKCFSNTSLDSISLPCSLRLIADGAFDGCRKLESVSFVPDLGRNVLRHIGSAAFSGCISLTRFPDYPLITVIEPYTFSLMNDKPDDDDDKRFILKNEEILGSRELLVFHANCKIRKIGEYAFFNRKLPKILIIPSSVSSIKFGAFACDEKATPPDLTRFQASLNEEGIQSGLTELRFSDRGPDDGILTIGGNAFSFREIGKVQIPGFVRVDPWAFKNCKGFCPTLGLESIPEAVSVVHGGITRRGFMSYDGGEESLKNRRRIAVRDLNLQFFTKKKFIEDAIARLLKMQSPIMDESY